MSRAERLAKEFTELLDQFEQLSLMEQEECREKVGWPRRTKLHRVKERTHWNRQAEQAVKDEPDLDDVDLILRVPEVGSEEKRNKLREFLSKHGMKWDDVHEYVFFHFHPEWYETPASLPIGKHFFIGEVLFDDVVTIHVQYDRAKLIARLRDLAPVAIVAKDEEKAQRKTLGWLILGPFAERGNGLEQDKAFERILLMPDVVYRQEGGGDNDIAFMSVKDAAPELRNIVNEIAGISMEEIERSDKEFAGVVEQCLSDGITRALAVAARNFFISVVEFVLSEDGQVSAARYKELTQNKINYLRVQERGGKRNAKIAALPEHIKEALGAEYVRLQNELSDIKRDAKTYYQKNPKNWRTHFLLDYPLFDSHVDLLNEIEAWFGELPDEEMPEKVRAPWEIRIELAARKTIPNYQRYDATPDVLKEHAILPITGN
ncbi:MAG TPA: hypothetical protein VF131_23010 [Blastocatellia bacterium]|nr:hypothetical protein [Blastocatellia bacterium]